MKLKVLINGLILHELTSGIHHSLEQLIWHMDSVVRDEAISVFLPESYRGRLEHLRNISIRKLPRQRGNAMKRIWRENFELAKIFKKEGFDLFHGPAGSLPLTIPGRKSIITVHDLLAYEKPILCQRRTLAYHRVFMFSFLRRARAIIAVSDTVKQSIMHKFGVKEHKIQVIYHGVDDRLRTIVVPAILQEVRNKYRLPDNYILYLGNLESKKNIPLIIRAYSILKNRNSAITHKLVLAGRARWGYSRIAQEVKNSEFSNHILEPGFIDTVDLPAVYSMASIFVFPSLYEGFGIPPLEAMACEVPVIVSDRGSLPEVAGSGAILVNASDVAELYEAMLRLLYDKQLSKELVEKGRIVANNFNWEKAARATLEIYNNAFDNA